MLNKPHISAVHFLQGRKRESGKTFSRLRQKHGGIFCIPWTKPHIIKKGDRARSYWTLQSPEPKSERNLKSWGRLPGCKAQRYQFSQQSDQQIATCRRFQSSAATLTHRYAEAGVSQSPAVPRFGQQHSGRSNSCPAHQNSNSQWNNASAFPQLHSSECRTSGGSPHLGRAHSPLHEACIPPFLF